MADSAQLLTELKEILREFVENSNYVLWNRLSGEYDLLRRSLQSTVNDALKPTGLVAVPLASCWALIRDGRFGEHIGEYFRRHREVNIDVARLARNSAALVATARCALIARKVAADGSGERDQLRTWAEHAARLLPDKGDSDVEADREPFTETNAQVNVVAEAFADPDQTGGNSAAAFYWTLYWFSQQETLESYKREIPVAAAYTRGRNGELVTLELARLLHRGRGQLIEHPEMALLPIGTTLIGGIERAWAYAGSQSACWNLKAQAIPQDGDSLSGAAAVGFDAVFNNDKYLSSCLITARLGENDDSLYPVGCQREKLEEAYKHGIRHAIIGGEPPVDERDQVEPLSESDLLKLTHLGLRISRARNVHEARVQAAGELGPFKYLGRYITKQRLDKDRNRRSQSWLGIEEQTEYLVRLWHFDDPRLKDFDRRSWDGELRTMYRLCSSPGADQWIVNIRDAGLDHDNQAYVMVLEAPGYDILDTVFKNRNQYSWLRRDNLRARDSRRLVWTGIRKVAAGIKLLHSQNVVHGGITPEVIFLNASVGPESWRLGGFEWSVMIDRILKLQDTNEVKQPHWTIPPEANDRTGAHSFEADWYALGMLAARCFYQLEALEFESLVELNRHVLEIINENPEPLSEYEKLLIVQLISSEPSERPYPPERILDALDRIIRNLETAASNDDDENPLVVVFGERRSDLARVTREAGFIPAPSDSTITYSFKNESHISALQDFLSENFKDAAVYPEPYMDDSYLLVGRLFNCTITQYNDRGRGLPTLAANWNVAEAGGFKELRGNYERATRLSGNLRFVAQCRVKQRLRYRSWTPYLPHIDKQKKLRHDLERLREFLRCTNQIELLFRYGEIFPYRIVEGPSTAALVESITIQEEKSPAGSREMPSYFRRAGSLGDFLQREQQMNKGVCKVLLTMQSSLKPTLRDQNESGWEVARILSGGRWPRIILRRNRVANDPPPKFGFIRTTGFRGQMTLVERRGKAIERLQEHSYLLRSLAEPGPVFIDTKQENLPFPLFAEELDKSKEAIITDILRVRPIYALQGPPGTGKSTLLAYLIREILTEDPVAQILVTAQAHGAVDVLRAKVTDEAYAETSEDEKPLAVRLRRRTSDDDESAPVEGTVEQVTKALLERVAAQLDNDAIDSPIRERWKQLVQRMLISAQNNITDEELAEFEQLVKTGANIVYSTTSARDLEQLADDNQSFDWSVVEEAGKVHGYDLALPLQAGHRWLLLGDQYQLEPYRYDDFMQAINDLDTVTKILYELRGSDGWAVDTEWLNSWRDRSPEDKKFFVDYAAKWLKPFNRIYNTLSDDVHGSGSKQTEDESIGAAAGFLKCQYRMHPVIGTLVSDTFYRSSVINRTVDENLEPKESVLHTFELHSYPNVDLGSKAIVWLDVPMTNAYRELGRPDDKPPYTNPHEAESARLFLEDLYQERPVNSPLELAVLSPYSQQVRLLENTLKGVRLPPGVTFRKSLGGNHHSPPLLAHTVDSFQGNQADVVVISLVRNNRQPPGKGLGFLDHPNRLNVLISRAERLLVLVGSWDFFMYQLQGITERNVEDELKYWSDLMAHLQKLFDEGMAIKLPIYERPKSSKRRHS